MSETNHCGKCGSDYPRGNDGAHSAPCFCGGDHPSCKHPG